MGDELQRSLGERVAGKSLFENRSISEVGNYQNPRALDSLRNGSFTTIGVHEIESLNSSKNSRGVPQRLAAAESQKRLKLPSLAQNFDISTNHSSALKEKRSQSTLKGGHSKA